jgi:hypothetical protein
MGEGHFVHHMYDITVHDLILPVFLVSSPELWWVHEHVPGPGHVETHKATGCFTLRTVNKSGQTFIDDKHMAGTP